MPRVSCPNVCIVTVTAMPQFPSMPGFLQTSKAVFNQVTRNAPISSKSWCALEDEVTPGMDMKGNPASDGETEGGRSAGPEVLASAPRSMVLGQGPGHVTGSLTQLPGELSLTQSSHAPSSPPLAQGSQV